MKGSVIALEPGLYYPDAGGVRVEDMFVVTVNRAKPLTTHLSQELEIS